MSILKMGLYAMKSSSLKRGVKDKKHQHNKSSQP
jgi:hypothetical protein